MGFIVSRIDQIIHEVAVKHSLTVAVLRGRSRLKEHSIARQECYTRLRDETPMSYPQIARVMKRKDHTTIIYGVRRHRELLKQKGEYL